VAFLVDGDSAGEKKADELRTRGRVEPERIVSWPANMAIEDVLSPRYLFEVMQEMRPPGTPFPPADELPGEGTVMARLATWAKAQEPRVLLIGKTALAYRVVEDLAERGSSNSQEILKTDARDVLIRLYEKIERGLESPAGGGAD